MAGVKFEKNSTEWRMFADFYKLCQDYWEPEDTDEWWGEVSVKADQFAKTYGNTAFVRTIGMAVIKGAEEKAEKRKERC